MYNPIHEVRDTTLLAELIASMTKNGWVGVPLVVGGDQLVTGAHRWAAWRAIGRKDHEIPVIELHDLFALAGVDMLDAHERHGCPTIVEPEYVSFLAELGRGLLEEYGIDLH